MKRNALVIFGFLILLTVGSVVGKTVSPFDSRTVSVKFVKVTLEEARKIALKKVAGTVEDEYTFEDEDGKITTFVFIITNKEEKTFEVQIDAENGDVLSSEELADEEDMEDEPPGS
jgi:hypothetical protein